MVTMVSYRSWLPWYLTAHGYHGKLQLMVTMVSYLSWLPWYLTSHGYHGILPVVYDAVRDEHLFHILLVMFGHTEQVEGVPLPVIWDLGKRKRKYYLFIP